MNTLNSPEIFPQQWFHNQQTNQNRTYYYNNLIIIFISTIIIHVLYQTGNSHTFLIRYSNHTSLVIFYRILLEIIIMISYGYFPWKSCKWKFIVIQVTLTVRFVTRRTTECFAKVSCFWGDYSWRYTATGLGFKL